MPLQIIQDIGSYAGFAAVVGLAVLSALYFSQARDVKRLREWAGRAPERADQPAPAPGRVVAQPQQRPAAPQVPAPGAATPAGQAAVQPPNGAGEGEEAEPEAPPAAATASNQGDTGEYEAAETDVPEAAPVPSRGAGEEQREPVPASAAAAATGAAPAGSVARSAQSAGEGDREREAAAGPAGQSAPGAVTPSSAGSGTGTPGPASPGAAPATRGGVRREGRPGSRPGSPPVSGRTGRAPARGPIPRAAQTAIIPPPSRAPWYRRLLASPRYLVLAIAGILVLGGGAAFGVTKLTEDDGAGQAPSQQADEGEGGSGGGGSSGGGRAAIDPKKVTVAVLNGTTVPGLAAQLADKIEGFGFQLGNVTNSTDQERAESVVLYAPRHEREATLVARRLRIDQRERSDAKTQGLAGDATVVVVAGIDQTR